VLGRIERDTARRGDDHAMKKLVSLGSLQLRIAAEGPADACEISVRSTVRISCAAWTVGSLSRMHPVVSTTEPSPDNFAARRNS
jgi:hypothetical protein